MALSPLDPQAARFMPTALLSESARQSWQIVSPLDLQDLDVGDVLWNPIGCYSGIITKLPDESNHMMHIAWHKHENEMPILDYELPSGIVSMYWLNWMIDPEFGRCRCGKCPSWHIACKED